MHYQRWKKYGSFDLPNRKKSPDGRCTVEGCAAVIRSANSPFCEVHYYRLRRNSKAGLHPRLVQCLQCGGPLSKKQEKFCSQQCCNRFPRQTPEFKSCVVCGTQFKHPGTNEVICSAKCEPALLKMWRKNYEQTDAFRESSRQREYLRRARKAAAPTEQFSRTDIFERDGWCCQLCAAPVNRQVKWPHPDFPTIDHIIPLARGGSHTRINVQCAHLICNLQKNDGRPRKPRPRNPLPGGKRSRQSKKLNGKVVTRQSGSEKHAATMAALGRRG